MSSRSETSARPSNGEGCREKEPVTLPNGLLKHAPALPPLLRGVRRRWIGVLVALGLGQAALAALSALALVEMQQAPAGASTPLLLALGLLVAAALGIGGLTHHERVVAEKLGQDYVHQLRLNLLGDARTPGHSTSLGVTVARTTNDLSGVRNWISQGIAPLVVAGPLIGGSLVTLALLDPYLAVAMALPLVILAGFLVGWARTALVKTRELRRKRGRLASRIAETVTASDGILASGGARRELRNLKGVSDTVVQRSVDRAVTVGAIRAGGIVAATLTTLLVAAVGTWMTLSPGVTMAAMAVAGIAATPVTELGRIVEYRQTYSASRMVLGPALAGAASRRRRAQEHRRASGAVPAPDLADHAITVHLDLPGLTPDGQPLRASSRERVHLVAEEDGTAHQYVRRLLELIPAPSADRPDSVWVDGENLRAVSPRRLRVLVGAASAGPVFERGSISRALHYRRPDLEGAYDQHLLDLVGLDLSILPTGGRTTLRRGGEPLTRSQRARLSLARALYGTPPLLLIDDLEGDLDDAGRAMLERVLADYRGVVVLIGSEGLAERIGAREHRLVETAPSSSEQAAGREPVGADDGSDDD